MKKSRILTATLTAALVGTLALTACSGGDSDSADGGNKEITFMFRGGTDEKAAYQAAIDKYTADTGVKVNVIVTDADQYATKLQAAVAGNNVPDVFYIEQASLQSYVASGVLMDITDAVDASGIDLDNIWPYGVNSYRFNGTVQGTSDGALYGLPKDVGPFSFGYNKTMFEAAGIPLPDKDTPLTWEEFVDICKQLTVDTDGDGVVDQWGTGLNVQWNLQSLVWGNGGDWTNEDHTEVTVDTPEFAEALQAFADLTNVDNVTPSAADAATLDTYQRWMAGEIGFFPVGPWDVSTYNDLDFDYDLIPWPTLGDESATWVGSLGIGVSNTSKYPDEAVQLATYLSADADAQQTLVDANIQIPNLIDMADTWAADTAAEPANRQEFLDIVQDYGHAMPAAFTYGAEWYDELWTNIQPVLDGKQTAADYLAQEQPKMQQLLDESIANAEQAG
ncbi:ABC transporter substrate-binding protein [Cellulomonas soli]|uniref:Sugar ABC transporter substrate-binding protein n=1 Tax=Cellulomonas soli TaxID=931535 RepID=A0A512PG94_9CELL|nr:sugar ABC transporter substrate-binding protein [Cellulomonas soli]NYI58068.1 multiple sugar transport system substrate-binding protein [Cellulomonas soli]GEP70203.1 sugar ABC transporter substrate-binding protein [Cellulomonas soli]